MIVFDLLYMKLLHNDYVIFIQMFVWLLQSLCGSIRIIQYGMILHNGFIILIKLFARM